MRTPGSSAKSLRMQDSFHKAPGYLGLQPLRIPGGWNIGWNTLYATSCADKGEFGGSSLFYATHAGRRFSIDVEFRPEFDPEGKFHLTVAYKPWPRTEKGRRRKDVPLAFDGDTEVVHRFETAEFERLAEALEEWIARCSVWVKEGS